jgi:hypothetical protein
MCLRRHALGIDSIPVRLRFDSRAAVPSANEEVMGMTVFAGMLIATILGVLLIPALCTLIGKLPRSKPGQAPAPTPPAPAAAGGGH